MYPQTQTIQQSYLQNLQYFRLFVIFAIVILLMSNPVLAQQSNNTQLDPIGIVDKIIGVLNGGLARGLATIALIIMGIGCWFGYFDFRKVGFFFLGILFVFGAAWILKQMGIGEGS